METWEVRLADGRVVSKQLPDGANDADVRAAFAKDMADARINVSQQSVQRPSNEDYWRNFLTGQGEIKNSERTVRNYLAEGAADVAGSLGAGDRYARHFGDRFSNFLDLTPVGNVMGLEEGASDFSRGLATGDVALAGLGGLSALLSIVPMGGAARKPVDSLADGFRNMLADDSGAIRAWHGSPHDFDRFDMSKIGTGEGHQSFGRGLYFAESPEVATGYQRRLSKGQPGRLYEVNLRPEPTDFLDRELYLGEQSPKVQEAIASIPQNVWDTIGDDLDSFGMNPIEPDDMSYKGHHLIRALERYASEGDIAAHIPWDDPRQHVSEYFRQQGLPGFSFFDQRSRDLGAGTRNYVVFDDSIIDILNKF